MSTPLGDLLVQRGVVSPDQVQQAAAREAEQGTTLGRALVDLGAITEATLYETVAEQIGVPFADCRAGAVDPEAAALLPRDVAEHHSALPVRFEGADAVLVAVTDPGNAEALSAVEWLTGLTAHPGLAVPDDLAQAIANLADADAQAGTAPAAVPAPSDGPASAGRDPASESARAPAREPDLDPAGPVLAFEEETAADLDAILADLVKRGGSDVHLTAGLPPMLRQHGELVPLEEYPVNTPDELQKMLYGILTQRQREEFENELELDLSYSVPGLSRFRVNVFQQRGSIGAVMRVIPYEVVEFERLGIPEKVADFAHVPRGFVLVTGPTGSGKSTTLASLIDMINRTRPVHIVTIEDPIEFLHTHKRAIVNQREVRSDTHGFAPALRHVLRQDPDVILVGELRDLETIQVALTAAETGHLVFGTLHTQDAPQTIDRIIDVFPPHQQEQIRVQLAGALQGVVCQQLLRTADGDGRVAACEVMVATNAISALIREGKTHQMYSSLQSGKQHGMTTMDQSLARLVLAGKTSYDQALERAKDPAEFNRLAGRA